VYSDKDRVNAIRNNNYAKHDSGIKEKSRQYRLHYQCVHRSHKPIVTRTSKSHSKGVNNERQYRSQTNNPRSKAEPNDFNATPNQAM